MATFDIGETDFLLDGRPHRIMAGSLHYFRVHPSQWADRIRKAREMGLNTIETYIAWNAHSPSPDEFDTSGGLDVVRFLELVAAEGMHAIVRPGPYICAEWDNGGLPAWLFSDPAVGVRRSEPRYLAAVARYFDQLLPLIAPLQIDSGGPVILMQIENEYGAYGDDKDYLRELVRMTRDRGITVPLTTVDQPLDEMLERGGLDELHKTASFGSRSIERLTTLREHQPTGPLMCAEYWNGWFDSWGGFHHVTSVDQVAADFRQLMAAGASFCLYMFHGGTNFGFTNGANDKGTYEPIVTSYDYDAPLSEDGQPTEKYHALRAVISEFADVIEMSPSSRRAAPVFDVELTSRLSLFELVDGEKGWVHTELPLTADELGHYSGFTVYRTVVDESPARLLESIDVRDRAQVFLAGEPVGVLSRALHDSAISIPGGPAARLDVLVEDQGRVDYGPRIGERKGLTSDVRINGSVLRSWDTFGLTPATLQLLQSRVVTAGSVTDPRVPLTGPHFVRGSFEATGEVDLFVSTAGWGKGVLWINGFALGRYWSAGPGTTLYVPRGVLVDGANEVVVLELHGAASSVLHFVSHADLGKTEGQRGATEQ